MSMLKSEFITRPKKVNGFTGVCALMEYGDDQVAFICADADVLFEVVGELMPNADLAGIKFQNVTIIQAQ